MSGNRTFRIGDCLVEPDLDRISRGSEAVTVRPQVMDVLVFLASRGSQIVHTDELLEELWPGKVVTSASVYNCITELRHAFLDCDDGQPYVDTVPKRGYRLVAPVAGLEAPEEATSQTAASPFSRRMAFVVVSLLSAAVIMFAYDKWWTDTPPEQSIAVLPFKNVSDDPGNEYFSDGISEEILNLLAKVPELRVTSRSSAFSFKGKNLDIATMAAKLNVANVLEGSVRKSGNQLRITAQLIEVATDTHLWSDSYDFELEDIFAIQDEIAAAVVDALKITLLGNEPKAIETSPEAYTLYLQGRHFSKQVTAESFKQAETLLKEALEIDAGFAPAWTELGNVYWLQAGLYGSRSLDEGNELARHAIQRALSVDPRYGRAYAALAMVEMYYDWDYVMASQHVQQAQALDPGDAYILFIASNLNTTLGRVDESIDQARNAVALDPVSPSAHMRLGRTLYLANRLEEAAVSLRMVLSLSPNRFTARYILGWVLLAQGDAPAALAMMKQETSDAFRLAGTAIVQYKLYDIEASNAALLELIEKYAAVRAFLIAQVYAVRGEIDDAFHWLERAYDNHDRNMADILLQPHLANLHDDPRWEHFLDRMGLPH